MKQELKKGNVYRLKDYTAHYWFNGLYFVCIDATNEDKPATYEVSEDTGKSILEWEGEISNPSGIVYRNDNGNVKVHYYGNKQCYFQPDGPHHSRSLCGRPLQGSFSYLMGEIAVEGLACEECDSIMPIGQKRKELCLHCKEKAVSKIYNPCCSYDCWHNEFEGRKTAEQMSMYEKTEHFLMKNWKDKLKSKTPREQLPIEFLHGPSAPSPEHIREGSMRTNDVVMWVHFVNVWFKPWGRERKPHIENRIEACKNDVEIIRLMEELSNGKYKY